MRPEGEAAVPGTKSRLVAALAAGVVLLTGCADGTHPGSAAAVGDVKISTSQLDDVVKSVSAAQGEAIAPSAALQLMISSELAGQVADQRSVSVSDAEVASAMNQVVQDPQLLAKFQSDPVADEFLRDFARGQIGLIKLGGASGISDPGARQAAQKGSQLVAEEGAKIGVDVNPRYGTWSGDRIEAVSGSLSTPFAPQAPATPQQGEQPPR
jgi:hypothetical protein